MKLFISWSGPRSKAVAAILKEWFADTLQSVRPWYSEQDLSFGQWPTQLVSALQESDAGLICVTHENVKSAWMNFEAGFIASKSEPPPLMVLLLGLEPSGVDGPLSTFQQNRFDKTNILKILEWLNKLSETPLADSILNRIFHKNWPALEERVVNALGDNEQALAQMLLGGSRFSAGPSAAGTSTAIAVMVITQNLTTGETTSRRIQPGEWDKFVRNRNS